MDTWLACQACTTGYPQVKIKESKRPYCRRCILEAFKFTKIRVKKEVTQIVDRGRDSSSDASVGMDSGNSVPDEVEPVEIVTLDLTGLVTIGEASTT